MPAQAPHGGIRLGNMRLPGSNSGTVRSFSGKCPSIEQKSPFYFPSRRLPGYGKLPKQVCARPGAAEGSSAPSCPGRRKAVLAPQLSGGYPGGPPPGHALWVLSLVQEKVPRLPGRDPATLPLGLGRTYTPNFSATKLSTAASASSSSEQAPHHSLPPNGESSTVPLLLLSPPDPLTLGSGGAPGSCPPRLSAFTHPIFPLRSYPPRPAHRPACTAGSRRPWRSRACRPLCRRRWWRWP